MNPNLQNVPVTAPVFTPSGSYSGALNEADGKLPVSAFLYQQSPVTQSFPLERLLSGQLQKLNVVNPKWDTGAELAKEFHALVERWKRETFSLSSLTKIYAHPAYQRIMAMGVAGIPLVLKELQKDQGHWFYALKFMAGNNVSDGMTNFEDAKAAWLEWGYKNNYI